LSIGGELSEFVSRKGRAKLVSLLLQKGWTNSKLAKDLGITRQAIHTWLNKEETHPCNSNLARVIDLALEADIVGTRKILVEELETFRKLLSKKCQVGT